MNIDILPKELKEDASTVEAINKIEESFYEYFETVGNALSSGLDPKSVQSMSAKILAVNIVRNAFDSAYARYVSYGVTERK